MSDLGAETWSPPKSVSVVLTTACNLTCTYCYQSRNQPQAMSWAVLRRSVELIASSTHPRPVFVFYGGEPLMSRKLIVRAVQLLRKMEDVNRPISIRLSTNGTLLNTYFVDFFEEHQVDVQFSFDGGPQAQDLRSPTSFDLLDRLSREIKIKRPRFLENRVNAAVTLSSGAVAHLFQSSKYLSFLGFREVSVTPLFSDDPGWTNSTTETLDRELDQIRRQCAWILEETGQITFSPLIRYRQSNDRELSDDQTMCSAPSGSQLIVDIDGTLAPCLLVAPSIAPCSPSPLADALSKINRGTLADPWNPSSLAIYREACQTTGLFCGRSKKYSSWGKCESCEFQTECHPCPVSSAWIPGNTDPDRIPDHICAFNRTLISHRRQMPTMPSNLERLRGTAPMPRAVDRLLARTR